PLPVALMDKADGRRHDVTKEPDPTGNKRHGEVTMATAASVTNLKPGFSPEEWKMRVDLAAAFRLAAINGWDELLFAHLSARVPGTPHRLLMHPAHLLFVEATAANLHRLDQRWTYVRQSFEQQY